LTEIESIVNREVLANARVETLEDVPIDVAVNEYHAMALFGEKYGDKVRVVKLSDGFLDRTLRRHAHRGHRRNRPHQDCQ
jgi:alanyl-tRNA synthetase